MEQSSIASKCIKKPLETITSGIRCVVGYAWKEYKVVIASVVVAVTAYKIHSSVQKYKRRQKWNSAGENVVIVHSFIRSKTIPSISPYVVKLETYLRMAGIRFEFEIEEPLGPKGKTPWITLNGEDYADSQLIMDFLGKKFNKNLCANLTDEQRGAARAITIMTDEHLVCGLVHWRWLADPDKRVFDLFNSPFLFKLFANNFRRKCRTRMISQGIGLHSDEDIQDMIMRDLAAISQYLGNKPFIMGNEPCEVDCSVFGMVAEFVWAAPGSPYAAALQSEYRNILDYTFRMKEKFWPDWERCLDN